MMSAHHLLWPLGAGAARRPWPALRGASLLAPSLRLWPAVVAGMLCLGLLWSFHQVVTEAVQQAQLRHVAAAAYADAKWRCNLLRGAEHSNCQANLVVAQGIQSALHNRDMAPSTTLAQSSF